MGPLFRLVIRSHPSRSLDAESLADSGKFIRKYPSHLEVIPPRLTMCIRLEDFARPSAAVMAAIRPLIGQCADVRRHGRTPGRFVGCVGRWRLRVEKNQSTLASQAAWGPMARLLRVDLPGSGEVVEDFLVRVADLADLPGT